MHGRDRVVHRRTHEHLPVATVPARHSAGHNRIDHSYVLCQHIYTVQVHHQEIIQC